MKVSAQDVKGLRQRTGAAMMDCKKALEASQGDADKAVDWLRKRGAALADKKADRAATEGLVHAYIHGDRVGVLLEVNSETDFVARNSDFKDFVHNVAMHIAAMAPRYISADSIPLDVLAHEKNILVEKNRGQGKKEEMLEKIAQGQLKKWHSEVCLMDQKYVKDPDHTVREYLQQTIGKIGENIVIRRFVRWRLGESS